MAKTIVGVDIGSDALRAVEISESGSGLPTLLRYQQLDLPAGVVSRGEITEPHAVGIAFKQLWSKGGFSSKRVVIGVGNQRVFARDLTVPKAPLSRIRESLPYQVQDLLPVPVGDALLDFYPISESTGENGPMVNGMLVAAVKDAVLGNVKAVQEAGLDPVHVDLVPFALCRALLTRQDVSGTVALIDVGATATTVLVADEGIPQFVRIVPTGGADLTAQLAQRLELETAQAESLKQKIGLLESAARNADELEAAKTLIEATGDLLVSLRNTVNYFSNVHPTTPVQRVIVTGGAGQLPGFVEALADILRLPIAFGDPLLSVKVAKSASASALAAAQPTLSVAIGLALGSAA